MTTSNGPVSTLPGHAATPVAGATCEKHPDRPSYRRIQGETDSFGCEYVEMCEECHTAYTHRDTTVESSGQCEWCHATKDDLRPYRDLDEGSSGRVYLVCQTCRSSGAESWQDDCDYDDEGDY